jgi:hypothetical protein
MYAGTLFHGALDLVTFFNIIIAGFGVSFLTAALIFWTTAKTSFGIDYSNGIQKFHVKRTSRLGGIAIMLGLLVGALMSDDRLGLSMAVCAVPVFAGGLIEDLTNKVGPNVRLLLAFFSAGLAFLWLGIGVNQTGVSPIDQLLVLPAASFLITLLVLLASQMVSISSTAFMGWQLAYRSSCWEVFLLWRGMLTMSPSLSFADYRSPALALFSSGIGPMGRFSLAIRELTCSDFGLLKSACYWFCATLTSPPSHQLSLASSP